MNSLYKTSPTSAGHWSVLCQWGWLPLPDVHWLSVTRVEWASGCWQGHRRWKSDLIMQHTVQGWGLLSQFPPFRYFLNFPALLKYILAIEYHVYIWQVSTQRSCGDICQIWMWFKDTDSYFCKIENFAYGEINERSFSNPHPRALITWSIVMMTSSNDNIS